MLLEGPFGGPSAPVIYRSRTTTLLRTSPASPRAAPKPIFPATLVGRPPTEDFYLGHATERIFLPLLADHA
ncbi:MAG: UbiD family decarboxylase [Gemmatimonadales bacterium]